MALGLLRRVVESQRGRSFLWWAPAFAAGAGLYFSLGVEPSPMLAAAAGGLALILMWFGRAVPWLLIVALACTGFAAAKFRAEMVAAPVLQATSPELRVTGRVEAVDHAAQRRLVIILAPHAIEGLASAKLPGRLRLSSPEAYGRPGLGALVTATARLSPLPTPVQPGGFDYGRSLWFDGIGGTGRFTGPLVISRPEMGLNTAVADWLAGVRRAMGARIHAVLDEPYASFAEALITGERSTIPPEINRSLLMSGLFHILSISGLHMWLLAGSVFWTVRAALALVPRLALDWPIKKWAAAAALLAGLFYMLLADSGVATTRSFIMIAVVFAAVMVDRPALSARNLGLAALIVLMFEPEAVMEASFQMSFLAVLALVAFYEGLARFRAGRSAAEAAHRHWSLRLILWALTALAVSSATSFVAGFSSALPAAYHFGRIAPYGVLANGLAIPVVGVVVMPMALLSALLMPLGLEQLPLMAMEAGLRLVILVSDYVASLPGADMIAPRPAPWAVLVLAGGLIALCLLRGPVRIGGLLIMALGGIMILKPPLPPDLLIEATGRNVALRDGAGHLVPAWPARARFAVGKWLLANGEEVGMATAAKRHGWRCGPHVCEASLQGRRVVYVSGAEGQRLDCASIDILIADHPLRGACTRVPVRIDRFDLWRSGAAALRIMPQGGIRVETARGQQGARPWVVRPEARARVFTSD